MRTGASKDHADVVSSALVPGHGLTWRSPGRGALGFVNADRRLYGLARQQAT
jgi:hypothetical protein